MYILISTEPIPHIHCLIRLALTFRISIQVLFTFQKNKFYSHSNRTSVFFHISQETIACSHFNKANSIHIPLKLYTWPYSITLHKSQFYTHIVSLDFMPVRNVIFYKDSYVKNRIILLSHFLVISACRRSV